MYLIPAPRTLVQRDGVCRLTLFREIMISAACPKEAWHHAGLLQEELDSLYGVRPDIAPDAGQQDGAGIVYRSVPALTGEQYRIRIDSTQAVLEAGTSAGLLYATQTMRQIIRQCGMVLPQLEIDDEPALPVRGFYHDTARGRVPSLDSLKKLADTCSFYKINQLQLYVEHNYRYARLDGLFADMTPLTAQEIREFDEYCRALHIELVPSMSSFGHLYELLRSRDYRHLNELEEIDPSFSFRGRMSHYTMDACSPEGIDLIKCMITEYASLFTSDKFNICADETFDLGTGRNRGEARRRGTISLYLDYVRELCEHVRSLGKTPLFWGDILQEHPRKAGDLADGAVCLYWNYDRDIREEKIRGLKENGIDALWLCPGANGWKHLIPRYEDAYVNISEMARAAGRYGAQGLLNTDWGDYGHINHPDFSVPGLICGAAFSWNADIPAFRDISRQISVVEYGDRSGTFLQTAADLSQGEVHSWGEAVDQKEGRAIIPQTDQSAETINAPLQAAMDRGYGLLPLLAPAGSSRMADLLLAAEGQKLLNLLGRRDLCTSMSWRHDLLKWYARYQELWRRVSREAELARIAEVIHWYTD